LPSRFQAESATVLLGKKAASFHGLPLRIVSPFRHSPNGRLALTMLVFDIAKENFCAGNRAGCSNKTCTVTVLAASHRGSGRCGVR
jgi:hypothetical protein